MFNFYVVFAGQDMITDDGRTTSCRPTFKTSWLQTKVQKMKDLSKTWVLTRKQIEDFRQKNGNENLDLSKAPSGTHGRYM